MSNWFQRSGDKPAGSAPTSPQLRPEDLQDLCAAKDRYIALLQRQLRDALEAKPSRHDWDDLTHQSGEVRADRDRLEAVVDRLRAENRKLLERLAARAT